jgi:signal transduction histidine kinase/DNA-binding response OmpR family regulator/ligand-binding sensor domain-containing protein
LRLIATIALLNLLAFASSGQKTFISNRIAVNDGLPQGFVSGIVQDDDGFIWMGTRDGLARYDGREFKVFYSNDRRSTNISSNIITSLHHDHKNRIWILHESKAIDVFFPREECFESFTTDSAYLQVFKQFSPNFIRVDSHDQVWLIDPGNGLWKINLSKHRVDHLSRRGTGLLCDTIRGVIETADKRCWVFMQKGIQQIDHQNKVVKTIRFDFPASHDIHINRNFAAGLAVADERSILVRELNKAFVFDTQQHSVKEIMVDHDRPDDIPGVTVPQKDASGNSYFELMRSLYKYDASTKSATKIWDGELEQAQSFLIDRSGVAWFGNSASGVQALNLTSLPFKSYTYTSGFFVDLLRQIGIVPDNTRWTQYTRLPQYTRDVQTRYDYDNSGNLWMTFGDNAAVVDSKTKMFTELKPLQGKDPAFYFAPMTVANDTCWRVYSLTGTPVYYDNRSAKWVYPLGEDWKLPAPTNILNVIKIRKTLWATTKHDGLLAIGLSTGETHWHKQTRIPGSWPTDELTDLEPDPTHDSLLWIGTRAGLVRFNVNTAGVQTFSVKTGLPNNTIYCIAADRNGFLWLSTNKGLCRFDPISFNVQNFSGNDGLQGDEFNSFHEFVAPDGRIAFGGTGGITVFDPQLIKDDAFQPSVQLTKVKINSEEVDATDNSGNFNGLLTDPAALNLAYDQNFFTFYFAGLQFNNVEKIQYRYRLTGLDRDWNHAGHLGMANYTKVPPGKYVLELNTSNTSGVWSSNIKRVFITIDPPLWKTPLAYVLYAILFVGAVAGYVRYTISRIRLKNLVELRDKEAVQLRQLDEVKSRFFTNITHEFRTPLTMIASPLEQLMKQDDLKPSHKKQLTLIQQNSHQLLQLVNQFLDLSKLEAGITRPAFTPGSPVTFIESLVMLFRPMAGNKKLQLIFQNEIEDSEYLIDLDKIGRIVNNLLSNAIKFTHPGGSITLSLAKIKRDTATDLVSLRVADTGIGIAADALPHIFDRFYQAEGKATGYHEGTGIGLALVKELTNLLNGTVTVESRVGHGTIFTVALPLTKVDRETQFVMEVSSSHNYHGDEANSADDGRPMILVAEDNDSLRRFLAEQLTPAYKVITACNGREAWEKIRSIVPSLVITDVMMPYLDGISLSRKIRETEETSHIGLIMLTARTSAESRMEGLQTGANDYIAKPFHFDELQLRIGNLLANQKKQRDYFYRQLVKEDNRGTKEVEDEFLKKAYVFLDDALANKKGIGVEDIASHFSMSSRTMNRKLQALVGLTVNEFIRSYRLGYATTLLRKGITVSEAAYEAGFESPQYFAQCFKVQYTMTPTEYIQKHQQ